jgi:hypothetical protein
LKNITEIGRIKLPHPIVKVVNNLLFLSSKKYDKLLYTNKIVIAEVKDEVKAVIRNFEKEIKIPWFM